MSYTPQLKDRGYYENRYDKIVVTQCRIFKRVLDNSLEKELSRIKEGRGETEIRNIDTYIRSMAMYFETGELAIKRDKMIREWMESDREMDEFYEHSHPKRYPLCIKCDGEMEIREKISFFSYTKNERHRILFMFACQKCSLRRAFYDDGEEFHHEKQKCEKCKSTDMNLEILHEKDMTIYRDTCHSCGHVKEDSFESTKEERDDNYIVDKEKYVLSEKERDKYLDEKRNLDQLSQLVKDGKNKQGSDIPKDDISIPERKRLDVLDMKDLVTKTLKKKKYKDITFSNPMVFKKGVNIEISVVGKELNKKEFLKLIQELLTNTNWKVDEKSILVNLGILQCKLKGE